MKIGRNDPCLCGSGKKYKKCCLEKNELERIRELVTSNHQTFHPNEINEWEPEEEESIFMSDNLPMVSEEDNKLIDNWWEAYKKMNNTVTEREHLVSFINKYPHLVEHLEIHWEVLFELGAKHFENGIYEIFVELLLRIRREFPDAYKKSFGYYDADLIYWHVAQGCLEEINPFFDWFKQDKKGEFDDKFEEVISFLRTTNHSDILLKALAKNTNNKQIISIRFNQILSRYLDKPVSEDSARSLINELVADGIGADLLTKTEEWNERIQQFKRPFTLWDDSFPKKKSQIMKYYFDITDNFAYFLYQKTELSFDSADFYADTIYQYYREVISNNKIHPKNVFCLEKQLIENNLYVKSWIWLDNAAEYIAQLNAFYYYAAYLKTCGNLTEEQKREFQVFITENYWNFYSKINKSGPEALSFKQFPLWKMNESL